MVTCLDALELPTNDSGVNASANARSRLVQEQLAGIVIVHVEKDIARCAEHIAEREVC